MTADFNGQQRIGLKDIGADEYLNELIIKKLLTAKDVCPFVEEILTSIKGSNIFNISNIHPEDFIKAIFPFNAFSKLK